MSQINYLNCIADQLTKVQHSENVYMVLISATLTTPWTIRMKHVSAHSAEKSKTDTLTTSQTMAVKSETDTLTTTQTVAEKSESDTLINGQPVAENSETDTLTTSQTVAEKSETDTLTTSQTVAEKSETEVSHRTASTVQYKTRKTPNHRI